MSYFYHRAHWNLKSRSMVRNENTRLEKQRVNAVVDLAERHMTYLGSRNRQGLLNLAAEYDAYRMPLTAKACRKEAEKL